MSSRNVMIFMGGLVLTLTIVLGLYYYNRGFTTTVEFKKADLQEKVERFVDENGEFGDGLKFTNPEVLLAEDNRVGLKVDVWASAYGKEGTGSLSATGSLSYRPDEGTFYLSELEVQEITLNGVPRFAMQMVTEYVQTGLNKLMPKIPIYEFKEGNLKEQAAELMLKGIVVTPEKVVAEVSTR